jgi:hypothetical protein
MESQAFPDPSSRARRSGTLSSTLATAGTVALNKAGGLASVRWLFFCVGVEMLCQLALLVEQLAPARILFRSAAFGTSLLLLFAIPNHGDIRHPARNTLLAVVGILTLSLFNPMGSTLTSVVAHYCFYLAVLGPVFWVGRLNVTSKTIQQLLILLWLFNFASAVIGVLQAYFPGTFQPSISTLIARDRIMAIKLTSGVWVPRPTGLTDVPGGAASSGLYATLLGLGVVFANPFRFARAAGAASMVAGVICIYLCQIRAMVVMLAICAVVLMLVFAASGRMSRLAAAVVLSVIIASAGFYLAYDLAGDSVTNRLASLVQDNPATVYQRNRGHFVETALVTLLPEYPLGAGFGRWGMMNAYFGDPEDGIWSEVQWSGWIIDGGIFLLVAYPLAACIAVWTAIRIGLDRSSNEDALWAGVVAAYCVGTVALTFSYSVFMSTGGLDFWLINSVLFYGVARKRALAVQADARPS